MSSIEKLVNQRIEALRPRLLDTTRKNPLVNNVITGRTAVYISVIDEKPQSIIDLLGNNRSMRIMPLPPLEDDNLPDERTPEFLKAFESTQQLDESYQTALSQLDFDNDPRAFDKQASLDRDLKDQIRAELDMPPRPTSGKQHDLVNHAKIYGINPSTTLPAADFEADDNRYHDDELQTLLLPESLSTRLLKIYNKQRVFEEERGLKVTYLVLGYLKWTMPDAPSSEDAFKTPLMLVPVHMERDRSPEGEVYHIQQIAEPHLNPVLKQKLEVDASLDLSELIEFIDENDTDIEGLFNLVQGLKPKRIRSWEVKREATLGIYPFQGIELYVDLDTSDIDFSKFGVLKQLMLGQASTDVALNDWSDWDFDSEQSDNIVPHLVLDADSSQYLALMKVACGENIALEGPPGSGKSQTIVNAIANALHDGKRVLFVAQKMTALEVVFARLQALGLEQFILPIRGSKADTQAFYEALEERVNMMSLVAPHQIGTLRKQLHQQRAALSAYIDLITRPIGSSAITVHELMGLTVKHYETLSRLPLSMKTITVNLGAYSPTFNLSDFESCQGAIISWANQLADATIPASSPWAYADLEKIDYDAISVAMSQGDVHTLQLNHLISNQPTEAKEALIEIFEAHASPDISHALRIGQQWRESSDSNWAALLDRTEPVVGPLRELVELQHDAQALISKTRLSASFLEKCAEKASDLEHLINFLSMNGEKEFSNASVEDCLSSNKNDLDDYELAADTLKRLVANGFSLAPRAFCDALKAVSAIKADKGLVDLLRASSPESVAHELEIGQKLLASVYATLDQEQPIPAAKTIKSTKDTLESTGFFGRFGASYKAALSDAKTWLGLGDKSSVTRKLLASDLDALLNDVKKVGELSFFDPSEAIKFEHRNLWRERQSHLVESVANLRSFGIAENQFLPFVTDPLVDALHDFLTEKQAGGELDWSFLNEKLESLRQSVEYAHTQLESIVSASDFCHKNSLTTLKRIIEARSAAETWRQLSEQSSRLCDQLDIKSPVPTVQLLNEYLELLEASAKCHPQLVQHGIRESGTHISSALEDVLPQARSVESLFVRLLFGMGRGEEGHTVWGAKQELEVHLRDQTGFNNLIQRRNTLRAADDNGFGQLLVLMEQEGLLADAESVVPACLVQYLKSQADAQYGSKLLGYSGTTLNSARHKLRELDQELRKLAPKAVAAKTLQQSHPPDGIGFGRKSEYTDMALLKHELGKQRRTPPRKLLKRAGNALAELFPCWMMVPNAVAQFLPRKEVFDLVIIDEASQMTPETSISALMRASQAFICGDTNQLPPSNFFQGLSTDGDADEDISTDEESILELANTQFHPKHRLQWHYRSRHEELIAFSNHYIYDDELVIFPSPARSLGSMGVGLIQVNGTYQGGINPAEAQVMFEHITQFMRDQPHRSLGVVVMNQSQMEQIEAMVLRQAESDSVVADYIDAWADEDEGLQKFFVKNLENVQGDERDVIFIGTVYGCDPAGRFYQRFGPINGPSGKRRLNVLFTRAKEQIITFSSIPLGIFQPNESNEGARLLKLWLQYSANKQLGEVIAQSDRGGIPDSPFEEHVIAAVESLGYEPVSQVGVSNYHIDIGVRHPDYPLGYICGIEADGATYHSTKNARDRDRLRQEVLERLGWDLYRIWSTDWFRDPYGQTQLLKQHLHDTLAQKVASMPPRIEWEADVAAEDHREVQVMESLAINTGEVDSNSESEARIELPDEDMPKWSKEPDVEATGHVVAAVQPKSSANIGVDLAEPIQIGSKVAIRYLDGAKAGVTARFWLADVPDGQSISLPGFTVLKAEAPLAQALIDSVPGEIVSYPLNTGTVRVEVLEDLTT